MPTRQEAPRSSCARQHQRRGREDHHGPRRAQHAALAGASGTRPGAARRHCGQSGLGKQRDGDHDEERLAEVLAGAPERKSTI